MWVGADNDDGTSNSYEHQKNNVKEHQQQNEQLLTVQI
jgi:hypothetical protein